jgi:DNA helicase-2/ATP-dependent DNA helicase PcrA
VPGSVSHRADRDSLFHADLHIHSRYSRACSRDCDIAHLAWWALRKGITVVGSGDFTHPGWAEELKEKLIPAEPGLFRLRPEMAAQLQRESPPSCSQPVRFLLSAEISTIYRGGDRTRKVHHLLYAPTFEAADRITTALSKIGNLASDGRPILGLDSRHLLEITLDGGPGCYLVPAHVWTPWFAVLGSKSGFDSVADCYADLAGEVFAIETGLSSDPPMNWMCSSLDTYRLMSNSDAHSPPMLGREATTFGTRLDYFAMADALRTGDGLIGTIEFYPEEGKYHLDGHRKCGVRLEPAQTTGYDGSCPECGKRVTVGVLHRVAELADRPAGYRPPGAAGFTNLVQLPQIVGEILATGPKSKKVAAEVSRLVAAFGPEIRILSHVPLDELSQTGGSLLAEAVARLRRGEVRREAGYDGEYGVVRLFGPGELDRSAPLFEMPSPGACLRREARPPGPASQPRQGHGSGEAGHGEGPAADGPSGPAPAAVGARAHRGPRPAGQADRAPLGSGPAARGVPPDALDPDQRAAMLADGPLMIIAGPGTGKTRTLAHRLAHQILGHGAEPESCLALTFTRRAARELRERLAVLMPQQASRVTVTTFHGLGLAILRDHHDRAGLPGDFQIADDAARIEIAAELAGSLRDGRRLLAEAAADPARRELMVKALLARNMVDFDGLIELPAAMAHADPALAALLRDQWPLISVDEYQDIDAGQYGLLRLLAGSGRGLTAIGDPDQAIYGFRGADVRFFLRFAADFGSTTTRQLTRSYRASGAIVTAALQAIAPATLVPDRRLEAVSPRGAAVVFHEAADEHAEAAWIAAAIDRLLGGSSFHSLDSGRADGDGQDGIDLSDVAILYRTDAQAGPLGQALARAGLPFQKSSHDLLERRAGVAAILREMRLTSAGAGAGAGAGPITDDDVADGGLPGEQRPAAGVSAGARGGRQAAEGGAAVARRLRTAVRRLVAAGPGGAGPDSDPGHARAGRLAGDGWSVDIRSAGQILLPLARRCGSDLDRFRTEIALGAVADALDPRAAAVTLLTLHAAKGLEFEAVFLAGCERGLLPLWVPGAAPASGPALAEERRLLLAEERRLLFVGMTRARSRLFLSCAARRTRHGVTAAAGPSPFLAAISPALLDRPAAPRPRRPAGQQLRLL